ncbi:hypothetical protein [Thalassolituus sp.]|uniref:hypothetical protein n=1 Tax=Thalassolituus sp. TaxID=2030822 RepID=UPI003518BBC8
MKKTLASVCTAVFLIAGAGALTGCASLMGGGEKEVRLWTKNEDSLAGKKDVYVGHVAVVFQTEDKGSAKAESPMFSRHNRGDYANMTVVAKLNGVPESTMQEIADNARAQLVAQLQARGFNVLNYSDLTRHNKWDDGAVESPYRPSGIGSFLRNEDSSSLMFAPTGMQLFAGGQTKLWHLNNIADDLEVPVITAEYTIHFAYFGSEADRTVDYMTPTLSGRPTQTLTASVEMGQGISVAPYSGISYSLDAAGSFSDNGSIKLRDPVVVAGTYGTNEDTTSGGRKAANALSSFLGMFSGKSSKVTEFTINANPEHYKAGAEMAIEAANEKLFAALELN